MKYNETHLENETKKITSQQETWNNFVAKFDSIDELETMIINQLGHYDLSNLVKRATLRMEKYYMLEHMFVYKKTDGLGICYYPNYTTVKGDFQCQRYNLCDIEDKKPVERKRVFWFDENNEELEDYSNLKDYLEKKEIPFEDRMYHLEEFPELLNLIQNKQTTKPKQFQKIKLDRK